MNLAAKAALLSRNGAGTPGQNPQTVHMIMEKIYHNIHVVASRMRSGATGQQGLLLVPSFWLRAIVENTQNVAASRCSEIITKLGWMMLSILAFSEAFRDAVAKIEDSTWEELLACVSTNFASIEMLAKSRALPWEAALPQNPTLTPEQIKSSYNIMFTHPHEWHLTSTGEPARNTFDGNQQTNIDECLYEALLYGVKKKPRTWPSWVVWPTNPLTLPIRKRCNICRNKVCSSCSTQALLNPLVEIREFPNKGRGVRALQHIPANQVLAEYVGRILPWNQKEDSVYALLYEAHGKLLASISAAVYGNWTRYINHSCNSNTDFVYQQIGNKYLCCIKSFKDINIFEEITIDYGAAYWTGEYLCWCGHANCMYNTVEKIEKTRLDLIEQLNTEEDSPPRHSAV